MYKKEIYKQPTYCNGKLGHLAACGKLHNTGV